MRDRHASHYLELAEHAAAELWDSHVTGPFGSAAQLAWQARLEQEHDNIRAGLAWAAQQGRPEVLARWCAALWGFWFLHGHFDECRRWVEVALAGGARLPPGLRARLLGPWGMVAKLRGDYAAAVEPFEESLTFSGPSATSGMPRHSSTWWAWCSAATAISSRHDAGCRRAWRCLGRWVIPWSSGSDYSTSGRSCVTRASWPRRAGCWRKLSRYSTRTATCSRSW